MASIAFFSLSVLAAQYFMSLRKKTAIAHPSSDVSEVSIDDHSSQVFKFVITGGPCSGKTTGMERLQGFLRERGFRVFVVPEAATMLFMNGACISDFAKGCGYSFQQFVINTQMQLEDSFESYAKSTKERCVLLCDRGVMDGAAYMEDGEFIGLLNEVGLDKVTARDSRYNAAFHLVTAADGAEDFYTLANNQARHESKEEARAVDAKTQRAWAGHPHHIIIDNGQSFESKLEQLVRSLGVFLGLPSLARKPFKFQLLEVPDLSKLPNVQIFDVEKIMLSESFSKPNGSFMSEKSDESGDGKGSVLYSFIRKRSQGSMHAYGLTAVRCLSTNQVVELKQVISARVFRTLSQLADHSRHVVRQRRYCFLWEKQSFHIYEYISPEHVRGTKVLLCQSEGEPVIPPFLRVGPKLSPEESKLMSSRFLSLKKA